MSRTFYKIANGTSTGVITAALIPASAFTMRIGAGARLFGYPTIARELFLSGSRWPHGCPASEG
jgi:hypothetical protein